MKGVICSITPVVPIVDICHEIPPGEIHRGAFILGQCFLDFPHGTVFVGVVDPEVGSNRLGIALKCKGYYFVGPDNGLFGFLKSDSNEHDSDIHVIENEEYLPSRISSTFHGRDIFAPVGAHLAGGLDLAKIGPRIESIKATAWPVAQYAKSHAVGEVVYVDRFDNLISNIGTNALPQLENLNLLGVSVSGRSIPLVKTFTDVERGALLAYFGSGGFLEIAVNGGNAAQTLSLNTGSRVELSPIR